MTEHDRATYRASDEFTAAYRAYRVRLRLANEAAQQYNRENLDHPVLPTMSNIDFSVRVVGFSDPHPDQPAPEGLSRAAGREYLIPKRGAAGNPWREVMARFDKYPSAEAEVFKPHGVPSHRLIGFAIQTTGIHDFGDEGVFVRTGVRFEEPSAHLTSVPQSEFYRAQESAAAISTAVTR